MRQLSHVPKLLAACAIAAANFFALESAVADPQKDQATTTLVNKVDANAEKAAFSYYLLQDSATQVVASGLAGVDPSAITVVDNTRSYGVYLKAFDRDNKGGGFAITPGRAKAPFPYVSVPEYLSKGLGGYWKRALNATTFSYAQGTSDVGGKSYRRRAATLSTSIYFKPERDDPVYVGITKDREWANAVFNNEEMMKRYREKVLMPPPPDGTSQEEINMILDARIVEFEPDIVAQVTKSRTKMEAELSKRWYRPMLSFVVGTGDAREESSGASARLGTHAAMVLRYGDGLGKATPGTMGKETANGKAPDNFEYGWALTASAKWVKDEPVLSSLGTASFVRKDATIVAVRGTMGNQTWRFLAEASNVKSRAGEVGEGTFRRALGVEWKLPFENPSLGWLHMRAGKRMDMKAGKEETAVLLTVTISPDVKGF